MKERPFLDSESPTPGPCREASRFLGVDLRLARV